MIVGEAKFFVHLVASTKIYQENYLTSKPIDPCDGVVLSYYNETRVPTSHKGSSWLIELKLCDLFLAVYYVRLAIPGTGDHFFHTIPL